MTDIALFSSHQREQLRADLVAQAHADSRITAAAHLGSAALDQLDPWSDIDLALSLAPDADPDQVLADWTTRLYSGHAAVAHYDIRRGTILYRVFLLASTLQIDLSFWPSAEFRAIGPKFRLIFGAAADPLPAPLPDSKDLIGMAWLYALHVRSSIARARLLQAEYMLSGMRDNVLALMSKRHGVDPVQARGLDDLPAEQRLQAAECLARSLEPAELKRAFQLTVDALLEELHQTDPAVAAKLERPLLLMVNSLAVN
jgi:hypothetical protein